MSDSALPLIKSVIAKLKATTAITNIVGQRIYTIVPQQATFPYIKVSVSSEDWSAKDYTGMRHILRVQGFSRQASVKEAGDIRAAVITALERQESALTIDSPFEIIRLDKSSLSVIITNEDGETQQSIVEFEVIIQ